MNKENFLTKEQRAWLIALEPWTAALFDRAKALPNGRSLRFLYAWMLAESFGHGPNHGWNPLNSTLHVNGNRPLIGPTQNAGNPVQRYLTPQIGALATWSTLSGVTTQQFLAGAAVKVRSPYAKVAAWLKHPISSPESLLIEAQGQIAKWGTNTTSSGTLKQLLKLNLTTDVSNAMVASVIRQMKFHN
jgi:hypothetical protein